MTVLLKMVNSQRSWIEENPLRIFRKGNDIPQALAAAAMGTSKTTIQMWESGGAYPSNDSMELLQAYLNDSYISSKWQEWYKSCPTSQRLTNFHYYSKGKRK